MTGIFGTYTLDMLKMGEVEKVRDGKVAEWRRAEGAVDAKEEVERRVKARVEGKQVARRRGLIWRGNEVSKKGGGSMPEGDRGDICSCPFSA